MPFASSGFSDRDGFYFAKDAQGGLVVIDPWIRGGDRTNTNFVILCVAGVGKSTAAKSIILSEFMSGTKIICVDPEREMKDMCRRLNGDWINCGGGSGGRINPLEIRPAPVDDEDEDGEKLYGDDGIGVGAMALHFKTFEVFIKLYLLVDPNVPQSLIFLQNVAKRARKYEVGLIIISHSVVDFLDPAVKL